MMRSILLAAGILAGASILIADAVSTGGGGKGIGLSVAGSVGPGGRGGGGPLPALGATLLGQAVGAGGLFVLWRRRRNKNH